jgi:hypothetical protein
MEIHIALVAAQSADHLLQKAAWLSPVGVTCHEDHCQVCDKAAAHNLTLLREISSEVLKISAVKGSIRSKRRRCALDPSFRTEVTNHIFHGFGALAVLYHKQVWSPHLTSGDFGEYFRA